MTHVDTSTIEVPDVHDDYYIWFLFRRLFFPVSYFCLVFTLAIADMNMLKRSRTCQRLIASCQLPEASVRPNIVPAGIDGLELRLINNKADSCHILKIF